MSAIFMSYSSKDEVVVKTLARGFEAAHREVWFDHHLRGGEIWWETILSHIRGSSVFLFALSDHSLNSTACRAELEYAIALRRPILPVLVGLVSAMHHPLHDRQHVPFQPDDGTAGFVVLDAADRMSEQDSPLPQPLPPEPPTPFAYLGRIRRQIEDGPLDPAAQLEVIEQLRCSLGEETDRSVRGQIVAMLRMLVDQEWGDPQTKDKGDALIAAYEVMERTISGATMPIRNPVADGRPTTDWWAETATPTAFLRRVDEMVGALQDGRAYREATRGPGEPPVVPRAFVTPTGSLVVGGGAASEVATILAARAGRPVGPPSGWSAEPVDTPYFAGVGQAAAPGRTARGDVPGPPAGTARPAQVAEPERRPTVAPSAPAEAEEEEDTVPPTRRNLGLVALVLSGLFAGFVALVGRGSAAATFALPALMAVVALGFSAQVTKRAAAGRDGAARSASRTATVWGLVALAVAVAALAVILNIPVTG